MITQEYFKIGTQVKYLRHDTDLKVYSETGIIRAIFVDQNDRLMVQVKKGDDAYNVHYCTINHDADLKAAYGLLIKNIKQTSADGDKIVEDVVSDYNGRVQSLTDNLLGDPIVFDEIKE